MARRIQHRKGFNLARIMGEATIAVDSSFPKNAEEFRKMLLNHERTQAVVARYAAKTISFLRAQMKQGNSTLVGEAFTTPDFVYDLLTHATQPQTRFIFELFRELSREVQAHVIRTQNAAYAFVSMPRLKQDVVAAVEKLDEQTKKEFYGNSLIADLLKVIPKKKYSSPNRGYIY
jgi:hypothetical protein